MDRDLYKQSKFVLSLLLVQFYDPGPCDAGLL